jgi:hypoxanthine phosphoribosyltransferase
MDIRLSWSLYGDMLIELCHKIKESGVKYDSIVGIMRGGYVVGLYLSNHLKIPLLGIQVQNHKYNEPERGVKKSELTVEEFYGIGEFGKKVLLVDEIVDSGETMTAVTLILHDLDKKVDTASIICGPIIKPTYYVDSIPDGYWVVFPYEPERV